MSSYSISFRSERNTFTAEGILVAREVTHYADYKDVDVSVSLALYGPDWRILGWKGTLSWSDKQRIKDIVMSAWVDHQIQSE